MLNLIKINKKCKVEVDDAKVKIKLIKNDLLPFYTKNKKNFKKIVEEMKKYDEVVIVDK